MEEIDCSKHGVTRVYPGTSRCQTCIDEEIAAYPLEVLTKGTAAGMGLHKYYTARPCKHGHVSSRYTSSGVCCSCNAVRSSDRQRVERQLRSDGGIRLCLTVRPEHAPMVRAFAESLSTSVPCAHEFKPFVGGVTKCAKCGDEA